MIKLSTVHKFYHGSPIELLKLGGPDKQLFLTPKKGIASLFTLDKNELRRLLGNPKSSSWGYPAWSAPDSELDDVLKEIFAKHSVEGAPILKGRAKGNLYTVEVDDSTLSPFGKSPLSREAIYTGPSLTPVHLEKTDIPYTAEFDPEELLRLKRRLLKTGMLKEESGKYLIYSKDGSKLLGTHSTKEKALAQERAIHMSKKSVISKVAILTNDEEAQLFHLLNKLEVKQDSMDYAPMGIGLGTSFGFVTAPELVKSKVKGGIIGAALGGGLGAILNKLTQPELSDAIEKTSNLKLAKLINS